MAHGPINIRFTTVYVDMLILVRLYAACLTTVSNSASKAFLASTDPLNMGPGYVIQHYHSKSNWDIKQKCFFSSVRLKGK